MRVGNGGFTYLNNMQQNDPEKFCEKMNEQAKLMIGARPLNKGEEFDKAWQIVHLAITKSCLLSRTLYNNENPSKTLCPVHSGKWAGIHCGWPDQVWSNGKPVEESPMLREWYNQGCRCFLHTCGCTTGWLPDENCGCLNSNEHS